MLSAVAQPIINSVLPDDYIGPNSNGIKNTGVAISPNSGNSQVVASVWDDGGAIRLDIKDYTGSMLSYSGAISAGTDPDIEFSESINNFFVSHSLGNTIYLSQYTYGAGGYAISGVPVQVNINSSEEYANIDYTFDASGNGRGVITWTESHVLKARSFFIGIGSPILGPVSSIGTTMSYTPVSYYPDVALCTGSDKYILSTVEATTGNMEVYEELISDLVAGNAPQDLPQTYVAPSGFEFEFPRIATPHNLASGNFTAEDYTVTARISKPSPPIYGIVGASLKNGVYSNLYEVSTGSSKAWCMYPTVAYNSDRVKFLWAADYSSGSFWVPQNSSPKKDVLLAEFKWDAGISKMVNMFSDGRLFEVNNVQTFGVSGFGNSSIAETRDNVGGASNLDKNAFLYYNQSTLAIYRKFINSTASPKREGLLEQEELVWNNNDGIYSLSTDNLKNYTFQLIDMTGRSINLNQISDKLDNELIIDSSTLTNGTYVLICEKEGTIQSFKLVSNK